MTEPPGARLPVGKVTVDVRPLFARGIGVHDDVIGIDAVAVAEHLTNRDAAFGLLPPVEHGSELLSGHGQCAGIEQAGAAEVQHDFGNASGHEDLHRGEVAGAVGKGVDDTRDFAVNAVPVIDRGAAQAGRVGDGGDVEDEVGGSAEGRVNDHGVGDGGIGEDALHGKVHGFEAQDRAGRAPRHIEPDRLSGRRERSVGEGHAQSFAYDLGSRCRPKELASASRAGARSAEVFGSGFEGDFVVGEARADGLDAASVLALLGEEGGAAGDQHAGEVGRARERHHHGGKAFVAGGHADDAAAGGQRADLAAEDGGGVIAIRQGIEHAGRALGAAIAGIGAVCGKGDGVVGGEFLGRFLHEQADFPVARVIAQRDGGAVGAADAAVGAEDEDFLAAELGGVPPHAGILGPAEEVSGGAFEKHLGRDGDHALGAWSFGPDVEDGRVGVG